MKNNGRYIFGLGIGLVFILAVFAGAQITYLDRKDIKFGFKLVPEEREILKQTAFASVTDLAVHSEDLGEELVSTVIGFPKGVVPVPDKITRKKKGQPEIHYIYFFKEQDVENDEFGTKEVAVDLFDKSSLAKIFAEPRETSIIIVGKYKGVQYIGKREKTYPLIEAQYFFTKTLRDRKYYQGKDANWDIGKDTQSVRVIPSEKMRYDDGKQMGKYAINPNPTVIDNAKLLGYQPVISGYEGVTYIENKLVDLINRARREQNLPGLVINEQLRQAGRQHSTEMVKLNYFSHTSPTPEYANVSDRVNKAGVTDIEVGENIGYMPTGNVVGYGQVNTEDEVVAAMHKMWMDSPGHRANILNSKYNRVGLGIIRDSSGKYHGTQVFAVTKIELKGLAAEESGAEVNILCEGQCLVSDPEVSLWINGKSQDAVPMKESGKFNFVAKLTKNSGVFTFELGYRSKSGGSWYSIGNKFYIDTNKSASAMIQFGK